MIFILETLTFTIRVITTLKQPSKDRETVKTLKLNLRKPKGVVYTVDISNFKSVL